MVGNACGYAIGVKVGPSIFQRDDSRLFKKKYVDKTREFFEAYGNRAIVLARFVPIVRTFITVMAGVGQMGFRRFIIYSAVGGALWASGVTVLGYYLGQIAFVRNNIEAMLLAIVLVSVIPIAIEFLAGPAVAADRRGPEALTRAQPRAARQAPGRGPVGEPVVQPGLDPLPGAGGAVDDAPRPRRPRRPPRAAPRRRSAPSRRWSRCPRRRAPGGRRRRGPRSGAAGRAPSPPCAPRRRRARGPGRRRRAASRRPPGRRRGSDRRRRRTPSRR